MRAFALLELAWLLSWHRIAGAAGPGIIQPGWYRYLNRVRIGLFANAYQAVPHLRRSARALALFRPFAQQYLDKTLDFTIAALLEFV